jgi:flavin-dependent dehydrogenase
MDAGRLAGAAAAEAASCEDPSLLASYDAAWRARYGGMHSLSLRLKDAARRLPPSLLLPAARLLFAAVPGDVFWLSDLDRDRMGKVLGRFER